MTHKTRWLDRLLPISGRCRNIGMRRGLALYSAGLLVAGCTAGPGGPTQSQAPEVLAPGLYGISMGVAEDQPPHPVAARHPAAASIPVLAEPAAAISEPVEPAVVLPNDPDFAAWLDGVRAEARTRGISAATLDAALSDIVPIARVIELDRNQPETTITFERYSQRILSDTRIRNGRRLLAEHGDLLAEIGARFGVQPRFIVALWGIETNYGTFTGGFQVMHALASLAYDGRRSAYFREELMHALTIVEEGHIHPSVMVGSWAGAMGQSQFMPSSFIRYAIDYDGDGAKDIWSTPADIFASAANYLASVGWRDDIGWGREVRLPPGFNGALLGLETRKSLGEWHTLGVRRIDGGDLGGPTIEASIILHDGEGGRAFVIYENFRTTLHWNRSVYFATSVGQLSDLIAQRS